MPSYVRPTPGAKIRDPERRDVLPEGQWRPVTPNSYWHQRNADRHHGHGVELIHQEPPKGDWIEGEDPPEPVAESAPAAQPAPARRPPVKADDQPGSDA